MTDRHGPMRTGRFSVEIDDVEIEGWRSVTIPSSSTAPSGEGWGGTDFQNLEMERGIQPDDTQLYDWREAVASNDEDEGYKEITVTLMDEEGEGVLSWTFHDAWLSYYDPPDLDASADGDVATERVSIVYDSLERQEL